MRFSEEVVGGDSFNRILHERGGAVNQLLLVIDQELRRSRPVLGLQRAVDRLLPIPQLLILCCNLSMQLLLGFSAFDLEELFSQEVSKKVMELVTIHFQSPDQREIAVFKLGHESPCPFRLEKLVCSLRIDGGQQ